MESHLLTPKQVAERLQVSRRTVDRYLAAGILPYHPIGRLKRIDPKDLAAWLRRNRRQGAVRLPTARRTMAERVAAPAMQRDGE